MIHRELDETIEFIRKRPNMVAILTVCCEDGEIGYAKSYLSKQIALDDAGTIPARKIISDAVVVGLKRLMKLKPGATSP